MLQFIGGHLISHILDRRSGKSRDTRFRTDLQQLLCDLRPAGCSNRATSGNQCQRVILSRILPCLPPATAEPVLSPASPPAIPADIVASALTVCFCSSLSVDKSLTSGYSIPAIAFAASSPVAAPAAPAAALFPAAPQPHRPDGMRNGFRCRIVIDSHVVTNTIRQLRRGCPASAAVRSLPASP